MKNIHFATNNEKWDFIKRINEDYYYLLLPLRNLKKEYYIIFVFESWQTYEFWHTAAAYVRLD